MTTSDKPKVTVLISTYNRPQYLAEAIQSVVDQTFQNWELIVLNDGGIDVADVVAGFHDSRVIYVPDETNRGAAHRFNQGLDMARGEYIAYLGDDDTYYPNHLAALSKALDENPEAAVAYSDLYAASSVADRRSGRRFILDKAMSVSRGFNREFMFHFNHVLHVSLMHRLDAAKRVGGFDENVKVLIEWSLNRRLAFLYDFVHVEVPTGEYHMAVFKSDRISVRERRSDESYKHNLRKIRCNFPDEPWTKVDRVDMLYVVDEWGEKLNAHLREIIDNFDHPMRIQLVNNEPSKTLAEINESLGNLTELRNINVLLPTERMTRPVAYRWAAKRHKTDYLFLVTPKLAAAKLPKRLFASLQYMKDNPACKALRWNGVEEDETFDCLIKYDYFMKCSNPRHGRVINLSAIAINLAKGFKFDAMFSRLKDLMDKKEYKESREVLDAMLKEKAGFPHIQFLIQYMFTVCMAQGDFATLERELRGLIDRGYRPDNLLRLGQMMAKQGRWVEAIDTLKEALAAHGLTEADFEASCFPFDIGRELGVFQLLLTLGQAYVEVNDPGQAARYFHLASKIKSGSHKPFLGFAKVYFNAGQLDRAEVALQKLPGKNARNDPETQRLLGTLCLKRKKPDLAFGCFMKAFELAPGDEQNVDPFYFAGATLGKWEEMYDPLATFTHLNPENGNGLARLAAVCLNMGSDALAADVAGRCLEVEPHNPIAKSITNRLREREERERKLEEERAAADKINVSPVLGAGGLQLDFSSAPMAW